MIELIRNKPGYKNTKLGLIPIDWEVKSLGDIGKIRMCKRVFNNETSLDAEIPFYKIGTFGKLSDAFISRKLYEDYKSRFSFPKKGEILISAAGTLGRTVIYDGSPSYFQDSNIVWIDNNEKLVLNEFLYYIYQTVRYDSEGGTIQRLYNSIISNTKFILPPLPEQQKIATILSKWDELIEEQTNLIAAKEKQKKGLMQQLLTGEVRFPGFEEEWEEKILGDICSFFSGGTPTSSNKSYYEGEIPFIGSGNINDDKVNQFITEEALKNSSAKMVQKGDLLYALYGATSGEVGISRIKGAINQAVLCIRSNQDLYFLYYFLSFQKNFIVSTFLQGGQGNLSAGIIRKITVNLPSLKEQKAISKCIAKCDEEIQSLKEELEAIKIQKKGLMQQLLTGKIRVKV